MKTVARFCPTCDRAEFPDDPDWVGENYRIRFFTDEGFGCYVNFNLRPDIVSLPDEEVPVEWGEWDLKWTVARAPDGTVMRYVWDGDGTLRFTLPDGRTVENDDCKKSRYWEWVE